MDVWVENVCCEFDVVFETIFTKLDEDFEFASLIRRLLGSKQFQKPLLQIIFDKLGLDAGNLTVADFVEVCLDFFLVDIAQHFSRANLVIAERSMGIRTE